MSNERNKETMESLVREKRSLRAACVNACQVIENNPPDIPTLDPEEVTVRTNSYVRGLQEAAHSSNTPISSDANLIIIQFINEMKEKTGQLKELSAYVKGCIKDVETETTRLRNLINISKEAQSKELNNNKSQEVQPKHLQNLQEKFDMVEVVLHGLIESLHPNCQASLKALLTELLQAKSENDSSGYISVTPENAATMELLKDLKIITLHPYDKTLAKLACDF